MWADEMDSKLGEVTKGCCDVGETFLKKSPQRTYCVFTSYCKEGPQAARHQAVKLQFWQPDGIPVVQVAFD